VLGNAAPKAVMPWLEAIKAQVMRPQKNPAPPKVMMHAETSTTVKELEVKVAVNGMLGCEAQATPIQEASEVMKAEARKVVKIMENTVVLGNATPEAVMPGQEAIEAQVMPTQKTPVSMAEMATPANVVLDDECPKTIMPDQVSMLKTFLYFITVVKA
jgi:hypothetical protein